MPSGLSLFKCKCGITLSNINKNTIPNRNPTAAGIHAIFPFVIFIDGISKDHTEAAIITPDAKPNKSFSTFLFILFFIKNTVAVPIVVPKNGIVSPTNNSIYSSFLSIK